MAINLFDDYYTTFGSNTGLAFYGGTFYPAWADNSTALPNPDRPNFDVAVAAVQAPWSSPKAGPVAVRVGLPGNPDPLSLLLASEIYVLLHTPDPAPLGLNQAGAVQTGVQRSQPSVLAPLTVDLLFAQEGASGAWEVTRSWLAGAGGPQREPLATGLALTSGRAGQR